MSIETEYENNTVVLDLECVECDVIYAIYTDVHGFVEEARYCPFCGTYNVDYDRVEE